MVCLTTDAFDASARGIERCRLDTDSPTFRDENEAEAENDGTQPAAVGTVATSQAPDPQAGPAGKPQDTAGGGDAITESPAGREPVARSERVLLFAQGEAPYVNGKPKAKLTTAQYDVVSALLKTGRSLTKDELDTKSRHGDARKILYRLVRDKDWKVVLPLPQETGGGYRIL